MYIVTVLFKIHAAHDAQFMTAMVSNAKTSLKDEPGCRQFDVCTSSSNTEDVFLYEVYDSKAAFEVHLVSKHFHEFNALTSTWVIAKTVNAFERTFPN